jgi:spermidine synthase/tetratricopeptide (TPR) repeat protein/MFS family permease
MRRSLAYFLFLLSGATALCYEVAWTRRLVLVFGSTTTAVALILAAYMLGLALGGEVGGRLADRSKRPAVLYAAAEGLIGVYALAFPWLVDAVRSVYLGLGTAATPVLFVGAFVLLLVPTFLMGATLPFLVRATVSDASATGATVGRLYGANILGAVLGTGTTGFWLMENAGVMGATRWSAGVNLLIAVVGYAAFRGQGTVPVSAPAVPQARKPDVAGNGDSPPGGGAASAMRAALVSAFAAGLVGLAAEVLWTRLLTFTLQGFTYTFTAMLATFLLGLALGGFVFGRVASRTADPVRVLVRLQVAVGVLAAAALIALTYHYPISGALWRLVDPHFTDLRVKHVVHLLASSAVVLLPPAFAMGGVFPLAAAAYRRGVGDVGARVGRLYAVNTVGCVLGSLVAGFVLAPTVGLTWGAAVVAMTSVAAALVVSALGGDAGARRFRGPAVGAAAVALLVFVAHPERPFLLRSQVFLGDKARENRLVETNNGRVCQVAIVDNDRERYRLLYTDEFEAAGTKPEYRYMRLLAHLPVALAEDPSRVLVICFGTGTTSGSVSTHSAVKRLDIVEISPEVLSVADEFRAVNRDVLHGAGRQDLDVAVHVDDGRNFVLRSKEQWGVITLEPLMPYTPAAIHLYTEDFYRECAPRLAPGGVMCQWIPLHAMNGEHFQQLVAAFTAVFPDSAMFFCDGAVALIGGNGPLSMSYARIAERLADPSAKADLADVGYDDPARALGTFVAGGEALRGFAKGADPVTDERPVLEFHPIPPRVMITHLWQNVLSMRTLRDAYDKLPVDVAGATSPDDVELRLKRALDVGKQMLHGAVALEANAYIAKDARWNPNEALIAAHEAREAFRQAAALDPDDQSARRAVENAERAWETGFAVIAMQENDLEKAERYLRRALEFRGAAQEDVAWTRLAETLNREEKFDEALEAAAEATRLFPRGFEARCERAYARAALGDAQGAAADYLRALEGEDPSSIDVPKRPDQSTRLRADAERALAAAPNPADPGSLDARIDAALGGEGTARVPADLVLRVLAADQPTEYAAHFASDLAVAADASKPDAERAAAIVRLRRARPDGAARAAGRILADDGLAPATYAAAAETLAATDPRRLAGLLGSKRPPVVVVACVQAAQKIGGLRFVDPLLRLLLDASTDVRRAAQLALFAFFGERAPRLARLDPAAFPAKPYRDAVDDVRAWWLRERDQADPPR